MPETLRRLTYELVLALWLAIPASLLVDACWWNLFGHTCTGIRWDAYRAVAAAFWSLIGPLMAALSSSGG